MDVTFNKEGNPAVAFSKNNNSLFTSEQPAKPTSKVETDIEPLKVQKLEISPWYDSANSYPDDLKSKYLKKSTVLRSAIDYKIRLAIGQGIYACTVTGYDKDGNELLKPVQNKDINKFMRSRMVRRYLLKAYNDLYSYGNAFPYIRMNAKKNYAASIDVNDAPFCRYTVIKNGKIENCVISGKWNDGPSKADDVIPVIQLLDPPDVILERARKMERYVYPLDIPTSGNIYYALPALDTAKESGHLDITLKTAEYKKKMFDNQMSIKYHIRIPYAYWEDRYPRGQYKNEKKRKELIQADLDTFEDELTTAENAKKAIITHFKMNQQGRPEEKWDIEVIDDKFKNDQYLPQAAASNAEILTSMSINPAIKGMSMAAGPYAGNAGSGSDIREAFLVDVALAWIDRQEILDPLELMLAINWPKEKNIELRFRNTVLTTLDKGSGTEKNVS